MGVASSVRNHFRQCSGKGTNSDAAVRSEPRNCPTDTSITPRCGSYSARLDSIGNSAWILSDRMVTTRGRPNKTRRTWFSIRRGRLRKRNSEPLKHAERDFRLRGNDRGRSRGRTLFLGKIHPAYHCNARTPVDPRAARARVYDFSGENESRRRCPCTRFIVCQKLFYLFPPNHFVTAWFIRILSLTHSLTHSLSSQPTRARRQINIDLATRNNVYKRPAARGVRLDDDRFHKRICSRSYAWLTPLRRARGLSLRTRTTTRTSQSCNNNTSTTNRTWSRTASIECSRGLNLALLFTRHTGYCIISKKFWLWQSVRVMY